MDAFFVIVILLMIAYVANVLENMRAVILNQEKTIEKIRRELDEQKRLTKRLSN